MERRDAAEHRLWHARGHGDQVGFGEGELGEPKHAAADLEEAPFIPSGVQGPRMHPGSENLARVRSTAEPFNYGAGARRGG